MSRANWQARNQGRRASSFAESPARQWPGLCPRCPSELFEDPECLLDTRGQVPTQPRYLLVRGVPLLRGTGGTGRVAFWGVSLAATFFDLALHQTLCRQRGCPALGWLWEAQQKVGVLGELLPLEPADSPETYICSVAVQAFHPPRGAAGRGNRFGEGILGTWHFTYSLYLASKQLQVLLFLLYRWRPVTCLRE